MSKELLNALDDTGGKMFSIALNAKTRREDAKLKHDLSLDWEAVKQNAEGVQRDLTTSLRENPEMSEEDALKLVGAKGVSRYKKQGAMEEQVLKDAYADAQYVVAEEIRRTNEANAARVNGLRVNANLTDFETRAKAYLEANPNADLQAFAQDENNYSFIGEGVNAEIEQVGVGRIIQSLTTGQAIAQDKQSKLDLGQELIINGDFDGARDIMRSAGVSHDQIDQDFYYNAIEAAAKGDTSLLYKFADDNLGDAQLRATAEKAAEVYREAERTKENFENDRAVHASLDWLIKDGRVPPTVEAIDAHLNSLSDAEREKITPAIAAGLFTSWKIEHDSQTVEASITWDGTGSILHQNPGLDTEDLKSAMTAQELALLDSGDTDAMAVLMGNNWQGAVKPKALINELNRKLNGQFDPKSPNADKQLAQIDEGLQMIDKIRAVNPNAAVLTGLLGEASLKRHADLRILRDAYGLEAAVTRLQDRDSEPYPQVSVSQKGRAEVNRFVEQFEGETRQLARYFAEDFMRKGHSPDVLTDAMIEEVEAIVEHHAPEFNGTRIRNGQELIGAVNDAGRKHNQDPEHVLKRSVELAFTQYEDVFQEYGLIAEEKLEGAKITVSRQDGSIRFTDANGGFLPIPAMTADQFVSAWSSQQVDNSIEAREFRVRRAIIDGYKANGVEYTEKQLDDEVRMRLSGKTRRSYAERHAQARSGMGYNSRLEKGIQ